VKKKSAKVQEVAQPYIAKPADSGMRKKDGAAFQKVADKIFAERKELLRKLAQ
jgi:hypothetical protein